MVDLRLEMRKIRRAAATAATFCVFSGLAGYWLIPRILDLPGDLAARLAFALRADLFVIFWVILGVGLVSRGRRRSEADIHGSAFGPPSPAIAVHVAFLQNTLEQTLAAIAVHLALATQLTGSWLSMIPVSVFLFCIGRITFLRGYRKGAGGRAFGMVTTVLPTIIGFIAALALMAFSLRAPS